MRRVLYVKGAQMFLTEQEVARLLRCTPRKVQWLRHTGRLAYHKGRPVLIARADLDAYLTSIRTDRAALERGKVPPDLAPATNDEMERRVRRLHMKMRYPRP